MKKCIVTVLLAMMMIALVAGCNQTTPTPTEDVPPTGTSSDPIDQQPTVDWPNKTVQVIVPFGAGGDTDLHCRTICDVLSRDLNQPFACTNITGNAGITGARQAKDSAEDGYTVLFHQSSFMVGSAIGLADFDYSDLDTASIICRDDSSVLFVNKKIGKYPDLDSFVEFGKNNPGELLYATTIGGYSQLQGLAVANALGIEVTCVDIGGNTEVIPSVVSGETDFVIGIYGTFKQYVDSGDFEPLCVLSPERLEALPDVPTVGEAAGLDWKLTKWFGYFFPKGTDPAIIAKFNAGVESAVATDQFKEHCDIYYVTPYYLGGEDAVKLLDDQYELTLEYKEMLMGTQS